MNNDLLVKHIKSFVAKSAKDSSKLKNDLAERQQHTAYYQGKTKDKILAMTDESIFEYISQLWAMQIWGNKQYAVDKIIERNGLKKLTTSLSELVWGTSEIDARWDAFRSRSKAWAQP